MDQDNKLDTLVKSNNKKVWIIVSVFILGVIGILIYAYSTKGTQIPNVSQVSDTTTARSEQSPQVPASGAVIITADGFMPQTMGIKKGAKVTWTNTDKAPHRIISDPHPAHNLLPQLDSKTALNTDETYSFIFEKSGVYTYHDENDPQKLQGSIQVE